MSLPSLIVFGSTLTSYDKFKKETTMNSRLYLGTNAQGTELKYDFKASDPAAKFTVEKANCGGGLVHIRSCYNNKYWCRKAGNSSDIVAGASAPKEESWQWDCTLFRPRILTGNSDGGKLVLQHVQSNNELRLANANYDEPGNSLTTQQMHKLAELIYKDYETLVHLPKYVTFKGDNEKFLTAGNTAVTFTDDNLSSLSVANEVYQTGDNKVRFKNLKTNDFWGVHGYENIEPNAGKFAQHFTEFEVEYVDRKEGVLALRYLETGKYCKRTDSGNPLSASADSKVKEARLKLVEPVRRREVTMEFRTNERMISNQSPTTIVDTSGTNPTNEQHTLTLQETKEYKESQSWTNSVSVSAGVETTFKTGLPGIVEGQIKVNLQTTYEHQWGKAIEKTKSITASYSMPLPPRKKGTIALIATEATCKIPFSYTQVDILYDGTRKITTGLNDGVFTDVQYLGFQYEAKTQSLDATDNPVGEIKLVDKRPVPKPQAN